MKLRPLNLDLLMGQEVLDGSAFHTLWIKQDNSAEAVSRTTLQSVRAYLNTWELSEREYREAVQGEVEEVIRALQEWLFLFRQAVIFPEAVQSIKAKVMQTGDADKAETERLIIEMRRAMAQIRLEQTVLDGLRNDVYREETPMEQMTRDIEEGE